MRLFTAITLPEDIKDTLERFSHGVDHCKWCDREQYHLTLSFTEEYHSPEHMLEALKAVVIAPFSLSIDGCGFFPGRNGGALWAAVNQSEELLALQASLCTILEKEQIPFDKKEFKPHITLGRIKGRYKEQELRSFLENSLFLQSNPFQVESFSLFSSQLTPEGPLYTEEGRLLLE